MSAPVAENTGGGVENKSVDELPVPKPSAMVPSPSAELTRESELQATAMAESILSSPIRKQKAGSVPPLPLPAASTTKDVSAAGVDAPVNMLQELQLDDVIVNGDTAPTVASVTAVDMKSGSNGVDAMVGNVGKQAKPTTTTTATAGGKADNNNETMTNDDNDKDDDENANDVNTNVAGGGGGGTTSNDETTKNSSPPAGSPVPAAATVAAPVPIVTDPSTTAAAATTTINNNNNNGPPPPAAAAAAAVPILPSLGAEYNHHHHHQYSFPHQQQQQQQQPQTLQLAEEVAAAAAASSHIGAEDRMAELCTVFIGDLARDVDEIGLMRALAPYGEVVRVDIKRDKQTGNNLGYAFAQFGNRQQAKYVKEKCQGMEIGSRRVRMGWAHKNKTLCVSDVDVRFTTDQIRHLFGQFGELVLDESFVKPNDNALSTAFVSFLARSDAERAKEALQNTLLGDYTIRISWGDCNMQRHCVHVQFNHVAPNAVVNEDTLAQYFNQFGRVVTVNIPRHRNPPRGTSPLKGYAFVHYEDSAGGVKSAAIAMATASGSEIMPGLRVGCSYGKKQAPPRSNNGPGSPNNSVSSGGSGGGGGGYYHQHSPPHHHHQQQQHQSNRYHQQQPHHHHHHLQQQLSPQHGYFQHHQQHPQQRFRSGSGSGGSNGRRRHSSHHSTPSPQQHHPQHPLSPPHLQLRHDQLHQMQQQQQQQPPQQQQVPPPQQQHQQPPYGAYAHHQQQQQQPSLLQQVGGHPAPYSNYPMQPYFYPPQQQMWAHPMYGNPGSNMPPPQMGPPPPHQQQQHPQQPPPQHQQQQQHQQPPPPAPQAQQNQKQPQQPSNNDGSNSNGGTAANYFR